MDTRRGKFHPDVLDAAIRQIVNFYIDKDIFNVGREVGRQLRTGELDALGVLNDVPEIPIVDAPGVDIFRQPQNRMLPFQADCTRCPRTVGARRYTIHLASCMRMGRRRVSSKRLSASI